MRDEVEKVRAKLDHYYREEQMLDLWTNRIKSQMEQLQQKAENHRTNDDEPFPLNFVSSGDIIDALYYPKQPTKLPKDEDVVVFESKPPSAIPQSSILAVHAPAASTIEIVAGSGNGKYNVFISKNTDLQKAQKAKKRNEIDDIENSDPYHPVDNDGTKRKASELFSLSPNKIARVNSTSSTSGEEEEPIELYLMPVVYNYGTQRMVSAGARLAPTTKEALHKAGFQVGAEEQHLEDDKYDWNSSPPILAKDEGVSDFFSESQGVVDNAEPGHYYGDGSHSYPPPPPGYTGSRGNAPPFPSEQRYQQ